MFRSVYALLVLLLTTASPARAQRQYFEFQVEKPQPKVLTLGVNAVDPHGAHTVLMRFTSWLYRQGQSYLEPDSVQIRVECYPGHGAGTGVTGASDRLFAIVVDDSVPWKLSPPQLDTLSDVSLRDGVAQFTIPRTRAQRLVTARRIEGQMGSTRFSLAPAQLTQLRAFLQRSP